MRKLSFLIFVLYSFLSNAQIQHAGLPIGKLSPNTATTRNITTHCTIEMPKFKIPKIDSLDIRYKTLRFAHTFEVSITPVNNGKWTLIDGKNVWQVNIKSKGASSINLIFNKFKLPKGGKLFIYNKDMTHVIGAFTEANNKTNEILPTMPVKGDEITVEYQEPTDAEFGAKIEISQVNHDYSNVFNLMKVGDFGDSQSCEKNASCYTNDIYQKAQRCVVKIIINGAELMSGTLLNNTKEDGTPYIITAAHGAQPRNRLPC